MDNKVYCKNCEHCAYEPIINAVGTIKRDAWENYCNSYPGFKLWVDKYRIRSIGTGRIQCKKPNLSNKPRGIKINECKK